MKRVLGIFLWIFLTAGFELMGIAGVASTEASLGITFLGYRHIDVI